MNQTTDEGVEGYVSYSPQDSHSFTPAPEGRCGSMEVSPENFVMSTDSSSVWLCIHKANKKKSFL